MLEQVRQGRLSIENAFSQLVNLPYEDLGSAKVDHHRAIRKGFPEVIFGPGKSPEDIARIAAAILDKSNILLVTKTSKEAFEEVQKYAPDASYDEITGMIVVDRRKNRMHIPGVLVISAGTADIPVACEASTTAELMGSQVEQIFDVGVAGIHRLLDTMPSLQKARIIIAVAGMEGALPSVIAGIAKAPVIAVPTSVGYGASFGGLASLLAMLNSCALGVGVVNIDNGFGAGYLAAVINNNAYTNLGTPEANNPPSTM